MNKRERESESVFLGVYNKKFQNNKSKNQVLINYLLSDHTEIVECS